MDNENNEIIGQTVKACGDSWVICRSKKYDGRIYYFNTLTGSSVWNLSIAEKQKAFIGNPHQECPEPQEAPSDLSKPGTSRKNTSDLAPKIYNKQVINNKFPGAAMDGSYPCFIPMAPMQPVYHPQQMMIPYPNSWIVPATQLQNYSAPLPSQTVKDSNSCLSARFELLAKERLKHVDNDPDVSNTIQRNIFNAANVPDYEDSEDSVPTQRQKFVKEKSSDDLRHVLLAKRRRKSFSEELNFDTPPPARTMSTDSNNFSESSENFSHIGINIKKLDGEDETEFDGSDDERWLSENMQNSSKSLIDVSPLKCLAGFSVCGHWFVVTDTNVLLNHLTLFNIIIHSDQQCHLLLPHSVETQLNMLSRGDNSVATTNARLACRLLLELQSSNKVITDQDHYNNFATDINYADGYDLTINCSLHLIRNNSHVVFLTNDKLLQEKSKSQYIPTFSIKELKTFLNNSQIHMETNKKPILVTIQNHQSSNIDENVKQVLDHIDSETKLDLPKLLRKEPEENSSQVRVEKVNAEIQTDPVMFEAYLLSQLNVLRQKHSMEKGVQASLESHTPSVEPNASSISTKSLRKRTICLNRKKSETERVQMENESEKRPYKWRRKRNVNVIESQDTEPCKGTEVSKPETISSIKTTTENDIVERSASVSECDDISVNSIKVQSTPIGLNRTVEESSESDSVISNSRSSGFSDVLTLKKSLPVFEITSQAMEDSLETGREEWTSRFVQIMEEIMTQILRRSGKETSIPPPWSIVEAAECIQRSAPSLPVKTAAMRLAAALTHSTLNGRAINCDLLSPNKFMNLFNCGFGLVRALQAVVKNCDDLKTSMNQLMALLDDIKNPKYFNNHSTSAHDFTDDSIVWKNGDSYVEFSERGKETKEDTKTPENNQISSEIRMVKEKYFITSLQLKPKDLENVVKANPEVTKRKSLRLKRAKDIEDVKKPKEKEESKPIVQNKDTGQQVPKVIMKFTEVPEYERRIQAYDNVECYDNNDDDIDIETDVGNNTEVQMADEEVPSDREDVLHEKDSNIDAVIRLFLKEIGKTFKDVHQFCSKTHEDFLGKANPNMTMKVDVRKKADYFQARIEKFIKILNDIIKREARGPATKVHSLIHRQGKDLSYRDVVKKCAEQANILYEALNTITNDLLISV